MYCRHLLWSLIQKDSVERIFELVLQTDSEMRAFATFLRVLGNECFVTENKVYLHNFVEFLNRVIVFCCKTDKFKPLLTLLIKEGVIEAYSQRLDELMSKNLDPERRVSVYFRTENKAA